MTQDLTLRALRAKHWPGVINAAHPTFTGIYDYQKEYDPRLRLALWLEAEADNIKRKFNGQWNLEAERRIDFEINHWPHMGSPNAKPDPSE